MKYLGAHVSSSGGVENAPINAAKIGAKAFALFVKNQMQWSAPPLTKKNIDGFKANMVEYGFNYKYVLPHDSYLINLGSPESEKHERALSSFIEEAQKCEQLSLKYLNFHPGSHLKLISEEECLRKIADSINTAISQTESLVFLIENTAGQGSNVGYKFEHIKTIIDEVKEKSRVGVCLDTCHTFAAGYDLRDKISFDATIVAFDKIIGIQYLKAAHINDSKKGLGSKVDRHESIGKGELGVETFKILMNDKRFDDIPLILETIDETLWAEEIKTLYSFIGK